jgi:hypothetical protein
MGARIASESAGPVGVRPAGFFPKSIEPRGVRSAFVAVQIETRRDRESLRAESVTHVRELKSYVISVVKERGQ